MQLLDVSRSSPMSHSLCGWAAQTKWLETPATGRNRKSHHPAAHPVGRAHTGVDGASAWRSGWIVRGTIQYSWSMRTVEQADQLQWTQVGIAGSRNDRDYSSASLSLSGLSCRRPQRETKSVWKWEIEKFIIRQPPIGEKDDYDSENSWISDGLPSSSRRSFFFFNSKVFIKE